MREITSYIIIIIIIFVVIVIIIFTIIIMDHNTKTFWQQAFFAGCWLANSKDIVIIIKPRVRVQIYSFFRFYLNSFIYEFVPFFKNVKK